MKEYDEKVTPVLLGGDLNAYSMAASFADAEGLISVCFARDKLAVCDLSSFTDLRVIPELDDVNTAVPALLELAQRRKGERLLLVPCADWYVELLEYAADALEGSFCFHVPRFEIWRIVSDKASFTKIMDKYGIEHPKTEIFDFDLGDIERRCREMKPPFVLKPSDSSEYWRHKFDGMKKVYFPDSLDEAKRISQKIYTSGYSGKILVQEYISKGSGRSSAAASVLTVFCDENARAVRAVLGDVLLEELGGTARGNYSAIVTRELDSISYKLIAMLEGIGYTGIANFDILRDGERSYCLELNPRQGRSFDYLRASGVNLAELLLAVVRGEKIERELGYPVGFWRSVGKKTVIKHAEDEGLLKAALALEKRGRCKTSYEFRRDRSVIRGLYVVSHLFREGRRYRMMSKLSRKSKLSRRGTRIT